MALQLFKRTLSVLLAVWGLLVAAQEDSDIKSINLRTHSLHEVNTVEILNSSVKQANHSSCIALPRWRHAIKMVRLRRLNSRSHRQPRPSDRPTTITSRLDLQSRTSDRDELGSRIRIQNIRHRQSIRRRICDVGHERASRAGDSIRYEGSV